MSVVLVKATTDFGLFEVLRVSSENTGPRGLNCLWIVVMLRFWVKVLIVADSLDGWRVKVVTVAGCSLDSGVQVTTLRVNDDTKTFKTFAPFFLIFNMFALVICRFISE